uniref:Uncharacterized protein n=1 Tax=Romanomermis culicivorax TaxID=13658 RepID=A0A915KBX2_ROMCU
MDGKPPVNSDVQGSKPDREPPPANRKSNGDMPNGMDLLVDDDDFASLEVCDLLDETCVYGSPIEDDDEAPNDVRTVVFVVVVEDFGVERLSPPAFEDALRTISPVTNVHLNATLESPYAKRAFFRRQVQRLITRRAAARSGLAVGVVDPLPNMANDSRTVIGRVRDVEQLVVGVEDVAVVVGLEAIEFEKCYALESLGYDSALKHFLLNSSHSHSLYKSDEENDDIDEVFICKNGGF